MALDINKLKARLQKLQSKGSSTERIDYKKMFFKPQLGKQTIRIVPNKFNPDIPFTEVIFHNQNVFKKSIYSLENWGEKDPVTQLRKELFNDSDPESKEISEETAKKLSPSTKAFAQVIVRGRESEGVLLWQLNKTTYEAILSVMAQDDEYGDITDIMDGTDLVVEGYNDSIMIGKKKVDYVAVTITPKRKTSPLSEDDTLVGKWLKDQKDPLEIYKKYSYDEIKGLLKNWLDPEASTEDETEEEVQVVNVEKEEEEVKPLKKTTKPKTPAPVAEKEEDDDDDDAPFVVDNKKSKEIVKGGKTNTKKNFNFFEDDED